MIFRFFELFSFSITFCAVIGLINSRYLKLPTTIAIMSSSILLSMIVIIFGKNGFSALEYQLYQSVKSLNFHEILMQGMLSYLLFAGALTINITHLRQCRFEIATLASFSTLCSASLIGFSCYYILPMLNHGIPLVYCLLFGALISPTDPIAVLAIFKEIGAHQKLDVTVSGESLFNDGVGIVLFLTIYQVAFQEANPTFISVTTLFLREAVGGISFGILLGIIGHKALKSTNDGKVQLLTTLAITTSGYGLANHLEVSGPLAMVAAGIIIGNKSRNLSLSKKNRHNLYTFWEMIDEILNAVLFFLIGIELLLISHSNWSYLVSVFAIVIVLVCRYITVSIPMSFFKRRKNYPNYFTAILVWGGLRGGLAVALALSLPENSNRDIILTMTYAVVLFSIIVQGLTVKPLVRASSKTVTST